MQKSIARAERDNDLIYHQDVPPASALPPIQEVPMAQSIVPPGLVDPKAAVGDDGVIFGELLGWGASVAIGEDHCNSRDGVVQQRADPEFVPPLRHLQ